ncbi:hypothetical protein BDR07DRAFT_1467079 [Suillus spraguei]|nr:hypothetical protein BDR07DRAFT_1467079 [Suillus spraguei]
MEVVHPISATILHLLRTAATLCMGVIFLHLAHSEPKIKYYAFYAGAHGIMMGVLGLLASRRIYRNALAKRNEAMKPQSSAETTHETIEIGTFGKTRTSRSFRECRFVGLSRVLDLACALYIVMQDSIFLVPLIQVIVL